MNTDIHDLTVITSLTLDREVVRDLTPGEMNGANGGGAAPQPDTSYSVMVTTAGEGSPISVVLTLITAVSYITLKK